MSKNLMDNIAQQLAPPVSRQPYQSHADGEHGADTSVVTIGTVTIFFADEDAE